MSITLKDIERYDKSYLKNSDKAFEELLKSHSLAEAMLNDEVVKENKYSFNLELPKTRIYHQGNTLRCWLYSVINLIKDDMAKALNQSSEELYLSGNYLAFFDKLEKSNTAYENIINSPLKRVEEFERLFLTKADGSQTYFTSPVRESGRVEYARSLIQKYGIVPYQCMPNTKHGNSSAEFIKLFSSKVKKDMFKLCYAKENGEDLAKLKDKFLNENYRFLSLIYGQPPQSFDYSYTNLQGEEVILKGISPLEFYQNYSSFKLDDFIVVGNLPMQGKSYYKKYSRKYSDNIYGENKIEYVNLPIEKLKEYALRQLKAGMPVTIACENKKYRNPASTVLDTRVFNYEQIGVEDMTKEEACTLKDITLKHWMSIRGVQLEDGKPVRWKVEDTAGADERNEGYYVMNDNFFEKCTFCLWIDKRFIEKDVALLQESEGEECYFDEPI